MKKISLYGLQIIFKSAAAGLCVVFATFTGYLYYTYNKVVTGDIKLEEAPSLLSALHQKKVDDAFARFERRIKMPDAPLDLPNPYEAPNP